MHQTSAHDTRQACCDVASGVFIDVRVEPILQLSGVGFPPAGQKRIWAFSCMRKDGVKIAQE